MPGFRIFYMDQRSGHITGSQDFSADDDLDAVKQAEAFFAGAPMELWTGNRKIKRWEAPIPRDERRAPGSPWESSGDKKPG